jgi:hypothetical protein
MHVFEKYFGGFMNEAFKRIFMGFAPTLYDDDLEDV